MKKMKWIEKLAGIIAAGALISFTMTGLLGCNQTLDDEDERSTTGGSTPGASSGSTGGTVENLTVAKTLKATENTGYTVKLGCDASAMKVTSVKYNGSELMPANTAYTLENLSFSGVNVSGLSADTWSVEYTYTMTKVGTDAWSDYNFEIADGNTENGALGYWSLRYDNYAVGYLNGYHEYGTWTSDHVGGVASSDAAYGGHWYGMENKIENFDHSQSLNKTLVMKIEKTDSAFVITIKSNGTEIWKCTNDKAVSSGESGSGESTGGEGTGVTVENLTAAKTLSATANAGYTVKLGCDGSAMKVTSVKYNGSELMPANTAYTLENLSFNGVNVSGLSADTWSVEYAYTMTKVGESAWTDYNFEIADGKTDNGALGYWSLRYDNYAVGYLNGYHEYGTWTSDHVEGVASSDAAYGGHWYGMVNNLGTLDHSQTLNKALVMKIEKTDSAFVITITSDGTEVWKCTNDKAVSSGNSGETTGESGTGESSGETGTGGESETNIPVAAYTAKLDGTDTGVTIVGNGSYADDEKFGKVFKNDGTAQRTSYLQLPADTLQHSATSKEMTIGFWVNNTTDDTGMYHPIFSAYAQKNTANTWPMFTLQSRGLAQVNCAGWCDFAAAQNDAGTNTESIAWLGEKGTWHYYTCVMTGTTLKVYADGTLINAWTIDGTSDGQVLSGMFTSTELVYVCLGGNQAWDWADTDAPYSFAKFSIWNTALSQEQIQAVVAAN